MSAPPKQPRKRSDPRSLLALMDPWPDSWAGVSQDRPVGTGLVAQMRPFVVHLQELDLSRKTIRRHLDNLWVLGGEIIRRVNDEPQLRKSEPRQLLFDSVADGQAPLAPHATEDEQRSLDATARRLLRFLLATDPR
jgi:hypothetical protein